MVVESNNINRAFSWVPQRKGLVIIRVNDSFVMKAWAKRYDGTKNLGHRRPKLKSHLASASGLKLISGSLPVTPVSFLPSSHIHPYQRS